MTRKEIAMENFLKGYNCCQSLVLAFSDILPIDADTLSKMACSFGGGMGRLREVCGAVSGMFMAAGLLYGYDGPEKGELKTEQYKRVQELGLKFEAANGTMICRELLGLSCKHDTPEPEARTEAYYQKRPCGEFIGSAAEILEAFIRENSPELLK